MAEQPRYSLGDGLRDALLSAAIVVTPIAVGLAQKEEPDPVVAAEQVVAAKTERVR